MPLAAVIGWVVNGIEIILRYKSMCGYSRRVKAQGASGIGVWLSIVEQMSFLAIPINTCIIYFGTDTASVVNSDGTVTSVTEHPSKQLSWLTKDDPELWTPENILLLVVGVEHLLIALKYFINSIISDVPRHIEKLDKKLPMVRKRAGRYLKHLSNTRMGRQMRTYEERCEREKTKQFKKQQEAEKAGAKKP